MLFDPLLIIYSHIRLCNRICLFNNFVLIKPVFVNTLHDPPCLKSRFQTISCPFITSSVISFSPLPRLDLLGHFLRLGPLPRPRTLMSLFLNFGLFLFYGKVKFCNLGFSIGRSENSGYFRKYCSQWLENW